MWYGQEYEIKETQCAESVSLCVNGRWLSGELRDLSHNPVPLPHYVKQGERYLIVVKDDTQQELGGRECTTEQDGTGIIPDGQSRVMLSGTLLPVLALSVGGYLSDTETIDIIVIVRPSYPCREARAWSQ